MAEFMRTDDVKGSTVNIIFMAYRYEDDPDRDGAKRLVLDTVEGTSHAKLQQAVLYKEAPSRDAFCVTLSARRLSVHSYAPRPRPSFRLAHDAEEGLHRSVWPFHLRVALPHCRIARHLAPEDAVLVELF